MDDMLTSIARHVRNIPGLCTPSRTQHFAPLQGRHVREDSWQMGWAGIHPTVLKGIPQVGQGCIGLRPWAVDQ